MDRRRALATVASVTFGAVAIAAAVGATTRVFNVAEASPGVGRVRPVTPPAPVIEQRVIDVEDPAPAATPVAPPATAPRAGHAPTTRAFTTGATTTSTGAAPPVASAAPPTTVARHEAEPIGGDD